MTVVIQELTDDNTFEPIGRVEDGEITEGEDELLAIDDEETWSRLSEAEMMERYDGPYIMAGVLEADDEADDVDPTTQEATPEGVPDDYNYVAPDEEPPEGHDVVQSPAGATYVSPDPVDDSDDGGADEGAEGGADDRPEQPNEAVEQAGREVEEAVGSILGPDPGRDEFEAAEEFLQDEVNVDDVDFSSLDAAQSERAARELGRMDELGSLEGVKSFRSSIPENVRSTQGSIPAHYDRDGRGISVNPDAFTEEVANTLHEEGVTSTPRQSHMMEHAEANHQHAENVAEGNAEANVDDTIEEAAEETGVELSEVAAHAGQLATATTASMVAETYVMAKNGYPTPDQIARLYRFLGGPTVADLTGGDGE